MKFLVPVLLTIHQHYQELYQNLEGTVLCCSLVCNFGVRLKDVGGGQGTGVDPGFCERGFKFGGK